MKFLLNILCLLGLHNWKLCYLENGRDVVCCQNCKWTLGGGKYDDLEKD